MKLGGVTRSQTHVNKRKFKKKKNQQQNAKEDAFKKCKSILVKIRTRRGEAKKEGRAKGSEPKGKKGVSGGGKGSHQEKDLVSLTK